MTLISKKELLKTMNISYGQLYRWKRENLIPEAWFIKQATPTGQETFFPKAKIITRVQAIVEAKDKYSLEELAQIFSPEQTAVMLGQQQLPQIAEISAAVQAALPASKESYSFSEIVLLIAASEIIEQLKLEPQLLVAKVLSIAPKLTTISSTLLLVKAADNYYCCLVKNGTMLGFEPELSICKEISLENIAGNIKIKYQNLFMGGTTNE